jgi:hypothetical protein
MESATFDRILELARQRKLTFSDHAYVKAEKSGILLTDLTRSLALAEVLEDYPGSWKGPSVLLLHIEPSGKPLHAVWGIAAGASEPAVLVTCYRPDPARWSEDFRKRKT